MPQRKTFESDDDLELELLSPEKTNVLLKDTEEHSSSDNDDEIISDDESDSAPEDIGFQESRETTLSRVKEAMKQIEEEKHRKKLKRKKQDELFKEQKRKKVEELNKKKLPEDFFKGLSESKTDLSESTETLRKNNSKKASYEEDHPEASLDDRLSDSDLESSENGDYIPIQKRDGVQAVHTKDALKQSLKTVLDSAANFKQNALFGNKVKRESAKDMRRKRLKKNVNRATIL